MIIHLQSTVDNTSVQVGDVAYYAIPGSVQDPVFVGGITEISASYIRVGSNSTIPQGAFLLFAKSSQCNTGSLKGYFAELTMENNSNDYAELYAVGAGVVESSK